jgi:hypothetical protein
MFSLITNQVMEFQSDMDEGKTPITLQYKVVLTSIFGGWAYVMM